MMWAIVNPFSMAPGRAVDPSNLSGLTCAVPLDPEHLCGSPASEVVVVGETAWVSCEECVPVLQEARR